MSNIIEFQTTEEPPDAQSRADPSQIFHIELSARKQRAIVRKLTEKAVGGDLQVITFIFDRMYGKPGVTHKQNRTAETGLLRLDLTLLNEEEMKTFASLFQKCVVSADSENDSSKGPVVRKRVSLSSGTSSIREGSTEGPVVVKASRSRRSPSQT